MPGRPLRKSCRHPKSCEAAMAAWLITHSCGLLSRTRQFPCCNQNPEHLQGRLDKGRMVPCEMATVDVLDIREVRAFSAESPQRPTPPLSCAKRGTIGAYRRMSNRWIERTRVRAAISTSGFSRAVSAFFDRKIAVAWSALRFCLTQRKRRGASGRELTGADSRSKGRQKYQGKDKPGLSCWGRIRRTLRSLHVHRKQFRWRRFFSRRAKQVRAYSLIGQPPLPYPPRAPTLPSPACGEGGWGRGYEEGLGGRGGPWKKKTWTRLNLDQCGALQNETIFRFRPPGAAHRGWK